MGVAVSVNRSGIVGYSDSRFGDAAGGLHDQVATVGRVAPSMVATHDQDDSLRKDK